MKHKFLVFAFVAQFALIALAFFNAYLPILFGDEVKLRARGYDPRDILSGNFVRLDYGVSVEESEFNATQNRKNFFVLLVDEDKNGVFKFGDIVLDEPQNALYVKAKRTYVWSDTLVIGAEKYFAPKEKALEIEHKLNALRSASEIPLTGNVELEDEYIGFGALVTLKIYKGKARIVNLEIIDGAKNDNLQGKADDELEPLTDSLCAQTGIAKTNSCDEIIIETDDTSNKDKESNKSVQNAVK